jgi:sugar lactone lactonase YvrE
MSKPPVDPVRWQPPPVGTLPEYGPAELTLVAVPGDAPEDVVADDDGFLWTGLIDGRVVRIDPNDGSTRVVANTGGRPLGLAPAADGRLLICDSPRGLLAMDRDSGSIEVLADSVGGRRLQFCSNVVGMPDGTIYFTESTSAFSYPHFKGALLEARGRGSLFRRDVDGTVTTVVGGLYFANGLTPTADGSALVFAETLARRLSKYWLTGSAAGSVTSLATELPGHPDNLSTGAGGRIWCAMASPANAAVDGLAQRSPLVRKLVWRLPDKLHPQLESVVWAVAFDPDSGAAVAGVRMTHPDFGIVTGLVEHDGRLWLSTIGYPALAYCAPPEDK